MSRATRIVLAVTTMTAVGMRSAAAQCAFGQDRALLGGSAWPTLCRLSNGTVYAAVMKTGDSTRILIKRSTDGGATWSQTAEFGPGLPTYAYSLRAFSNEAYLGLVANVSYSDTDVDPYFFRIRAADGGLDATADVSSLFDFEEVAI